MELFLLTQFHFVGGIVGVGRLSALSSNPSSNTKPPPPPPPVRGTEIRKAQNPRIYLASETHTYEKRKTERLLFSQQRRSEAARPPEELFVLFSTWHIKSIFGIHLHSLN